MILAVSFNLILEFNEHNIYVIFWKFSALNLGVSYLLTIHLCHIKSYVPEKKLLSKKIHVAAEKVIHTGRRTHRLLK